MSKPPGAGTFDIPEPEGGVRYVCPACQSKKPEPTLCFINRGPDISTHSAEMVTMTCGVCGSDPKGATSEDVHRWLQGQDMQKYRRSLNETLGDTAKRLGMKASELSTFEHGYRAGWKPFGERV